MFIGVDGIIVNKLNACGLTPTVSKVSSGALEFMPLFQVKFIQSFFDDAKKAPFNFKIVSTNLEDSSDAIVDDDSDGDDKPIVRGDLNIDHVEKPNQSNFCSLADLKLNKTDNILLILGSEGEGVSRTIAKHADHKVVIPPQLQMDALGKYPYNMVDSLNVGVSAALLLYHIRNVTLK